MQSSPRDGDWRGNRCRSIAALEIADRFRGSMAVDIGYLSAVGAGALSFLSPCVLPLVPPYLCYMAGVTVEDFRESSDRSRAARRAHRTGLGLDRLRARLHHGVRGARRRRLHHRPLPARLAGCAGGCCRHRHHIDGAQFSGRHPHSSAVARGALPGQGKPASAVAAYVMGLAFAFGWTPCIGPVLGPILTLAGGARRWARGHCCCLPIRSGSASRS